MRNFLITLFSLYTSIALSCGGGCSNGYFYSLLRQTNITAEEFYPFLRDECGKFYDDNRWFGEDSKVLDSKGNIALWKEILVDWNTHDLESAIYKADDSHWSNQNSEIDISARNYIAFARLCGDEFDYRKNKNSWDYDEIEQQKTVDTEGLLSKAAHLLSNEKNQQIRMRYYYQIIRVLHYSEKWEDAIELYEVKIQNIFPKNEIYYYITDQVAGCYYSTQKYEKAAYLFTKVLNKSMDRKKSSFMSYNFCTMKGADGRVFSNGVADDKDFLLIKGLRNFSDEFININDFIELDPNDRRVELLFMRALNNLEREVWPKYMRTEIKSISRSDGSGNFNGLLQIADDQATNGDVLNTDFWGIASSYLSFINQDIDIAIRKLSSVKSFPDQKKALSIVYEVFSWTEISLDNENYIFDVLKSYPMQYKKYSETINDLRNFILDKVAHLYYKNNKIAKAFLVHNSLRELKQIHSLELLNHLETFYHKPIESDFEESLYWRDNKESSLNYINQLKGIYYLYDKNPEMALMFFEKNQNYKSEMSIPSSIFSNNIIECFRCDVNEVMNDEVYAANIFAFIEPSFSKRELAMNLLKLIKLTTDEKAWKAKLANYLLANYYFNISNTGYYRGLLTDNTNVGVGIYLPDAWNIGYSMMGEVDDRIVNRRGYSLSLISVYEIHYFGLSEKALGYYQAAIDLSTDKELNARCAYLIAKCELNDFYNNGGEDTYMISGAGDWRGFEIELPYSNGFKALNESYANTEFHKMILEECSYFRYYSNNN